MKIINLKVYASRDELIEMLKNNEAVNKNVKFNTEKGTPHIHLKEKGEKVKLTCEYMGGATKDNAFFNGTRFSGRITERDGCSAVKGVVTTAPIFHLCLALMFVAFIVFCIVRQGFSVVPICLIIFDVFMYWNEFKKQGIIQRYLYRAVKRLEDRKTGNAAR